MENGQNIDLDSISERGIGEIYKRRLLFNNESFIFLDRNEKIKNIDVYW